MYFDNALRKIANDKGYKVGLDSKTGDVIVENPVTKKKISFKSGQGSEYGMGGMKDGYNIVSDVSLLDKALTADPGANTDYFSTAAGKYGSPYSENINKFLQNITNFKPYDYSSYNADTDPAFKQFKDSAIKAGNEAYADRYAGTAIPGVAESSVSRQIAETARKGYTDRIQDAIPTFAEKARQDYENAYAKNFDALNALMNVESNNLKNTGYIQENLANEAHTVALANYDDIAAEINRRTALDPNDPMIPYLQAERQNKIAVQDAKKAEADKTAWERTLEENKYKLDATRENRLATKPSDESDDTKYDVTKMGTSKQVENYYEYLKIFSGGGFGTWKDKPAEAYNHLVKNRKDIEEMVGTKLYKQLLSDVKGLDTVMGTVKAPTPPSDPTLGAIWTAMMNAPDPVEWLKQEAPYMTDKELEAARSWLPKE